MHKRTVISVVLALIVSVVISMLVYAAIIQLPRTGQVVTYTPHDDGALKQGAPSPAPRFIDNSDGTITDNQTGLIWLQNANCTFPAARVTFSSGKLTWADALTWNNSLSNCACGLSDGSHPGDWRLPNVNELESLVDVSQVPTLPANNSFASVQSNSYWTSTSAPGSLSNSAWYINLNDGTVNPDAKTNVKYVWAVRGGQAGTSTVSLSPTTKDFGGIAINVASSPQLFTVINSGTANLVVSSIVVTGNDSGMFTLNVGDGTGGSCGGTPTLAPGGSCTLLTSFAPTTSGAKAAAVRVASNDTATPNKDTALSGTGVLNGVCGGANGGTFSGAPTTNLCNPGNPSSVSGTGPWSWTCQGSDGGATASCSAAIQTYIVTFSAGSGGALSGTPSQSVNSGGSTTAVNASASTGYHFVNWTEGASVVSTNPTLTVSGVTSSHSYTANFAATIPSYTVGFSAGPGGSLTGTPNQSVDSGGSTTAVTASASSGYHFVNWTEGSSIVSTSSTLVVSGVTSAHNYTANFAPTIQAYTVTFRAGTGGSLTGTASQSVNSGGSTTAVTAIASTGYRFVNWTEGATVISTNSALTMSNVMSAHSYIANFVSTGQIAVPVMEGWWLLPGLLAGLGLFARRRKED